MQERKGRRKEGKDERNKGGRKRGRKGRRNKVTEGGKDRWDG